MLKRVPKFVWIIVLAVALSETLIWIGILQVDPIFWGCYWTSDKIGQYWIPELRLTYHQCFILFLNVAIIGAHIPIIVIVWLVAEKLHSKT